MLSRPVNYIFHRPAILGLIIIAISAISVTALADAPVPDIPKPEGKDQCVEPTDFMRKNHMDLLLHQRDETMHRGVRTKKHSLKECIDCHTVYDNSGQPVSHLNSKHFCVQCHEYASVSIDCFDCHASKPKQKKAERSL